MERQREAKRRQGFVLLMPSLSSSGLANQVTKGSDVVVSRQPGAGKIYTPIWANLKKCTGQQSPHAAFSALASGDGSGTVDVLQEPAFPPIVETKSSCDAFYFLYWLSDSWH